MKQSKRPTVVVLLPPVSEAGIRRLQQEAEVFVQPRDTLEAIRPLAGRVDAYVVRGGQTRVTREMMEVSPNLKVIGAWGAGVDAIDLKAATARGIPVVNSAGVGYRPVAEYAVALALCLTKRLFELDTLLRGGNVDWTDRSTYYGGELFEKTVGIIGYGNIGREVGRMYRTAFLAKVLAYDPFVNQGTATADDVTLVPLTRLLQKSDIVSVHCALTDTTRHLIGAKAISLMKPTALLINCARGPVVDQKALAAALRARTIAGAGLDVFAPEPPPPTEPLFQLKNVIVTPHIAGMTNETTARLAVNAAEQVLKTLRGERSEFCCNKEVYDRWSSRAR